MNCGALALKNNGRVHAAPQSDMSLPSGEPFEALEHHAVGGLLEGPPLALGSVEIIHDLNGNILHDDTRLGALEASTLKLVDSQCRSMCNS